MSRLYRVFKVDRARNVNGDFCRSADHVRAGNVRGAISQARLNDPGCLVTKVCELTDGGFDGKVVYQRNMAFAQVPGFSSPVILLEGAYIAGTGHIAGAFASEADARCEDPDSAAVGTVLWDELTPELQAIAENNSEILED